MHSPLLLFTSVLCLISCALASNLPRLDRQPTPGNTFYTIFPKNGTETSKTSDFVKDIVGTDDLLPWTNLKDQLISWTVEASPDEASKLRAYPDVESVVEFHPPEQPTSANVNARDTAAVQ